MTQCGWCKREWSTQAQANACERACGVRVANQVAAGKADERCDICQSVGCRGRCEEKMR